MALQKPRKVAISVTVYCWVTNKILALFIFPDKDPFIFAPALEVGSVKESGWEYPVFGYLDHEDAFALIKSHINAFFTNVLSI